MHELSLARDLIGAALNAVAREGGGRIRKLTVVVGPDAHTSEPALVLNLEAACQGTAAEGAAIDVRLAEAGGALLTEVDVEEVS